MLAGNGTKKSHLRPALKPNSNSFVRRGFRLKDVVPIHVWNEMVKIHDAKCSLVMLSIALLAGHALAADVKEVKKGASDVKIVFLDGELSLRPLADNAVRVRFSDGKAHESPSLVLTEKVQTPKFDLKESPDSISVSTAKMRVVVDRATGALRFQDANGKVFLAEKSGARVFQPCTEIGRA